jgi:ligand-binding sensor domain-containing protein
MKMNHTVIGGALIAVAGLVALGYGVGRFHADSTPAPAASAPASASAAAPAAKDPHRAGAQHAGVAAAQPAQEQPREGHVPYDRAAPFTHFRVGNRNVKSIYAEGKVVWVGTSGGVIRYDTATEQYKMYDNKNGLLSNGVFYVGKLKDKIAVGTYGGGLSLLDPKSDQFETYNVPDGLGDAFVYDVLEMKNGDVWIATWSGANVIRGGNLKDASRWELHTVESTKGGLPNDWVYGLAEGKNGEVWLATEGGLARYHGGKWDNWNHAKGQGAPYEKVKKDIEFTNDPAKQSVHHARQKEEMGLQNVQVAYNPNYVVALEVDAQGVVWVGTWGGGLGRFDGKTWKNYTVADGLPGNHVFMLHIDRGGQMWVGTHKGVTTLAKGKFGRVYTTNDGLFANNVFAMATDGDGAVWVGSFGGVSRIPKLPGRS